MKKIITYSFLFTFLLTSCGASKVIKSAESEFQGNWQLTDVSFPGATGFFDVTLFQTASSNCFIGSSWSFVPNNNRGKVYFEQSDCDVLEQNMVWSLRADESTNFDVLVKLAEDERASKQKQGSVWKLDNINAAKMQWSTSVNFQGKPVTIVLTFNKN